MTRTLNLREQLRQPETQRFLKRYSEAHGDRQVALRDVPLKNFVDVDSNLLETKVSQLFLKGAGEASGFWSDLINVVQLSAPIEEVPIISERDFEVRTGKITTAKLEESGGSVSRVQLDTTNDEHIRYTLIKVDGEDIRLRNFNVVERSIMAAGAAFSKNILNDVTSHYDGVSGNTQALSSDTRFVAVMKLLALIADDGFAGNRMAFEVNDFVQAITEETTGGDLPWLHMTQGQPLGENFGKGIMNGFVGNFLGKVPTYSIANEGGMGAGEILVVDKEAASVFGWAPGGEVQLATEIKTIEDVVNALIKAKYDIANGNANAVGVVTGA